MLIIPAIDLKDGKCVRLRQGRMEDSTVFGDDPVDMATKWVNAGARRLHLVDLNGAFAGEPVNGEIVKAIAVKYPNLPIQIGGGIRSAETIEAYLKAGVQWVIIGTKAVKEPEFVTQMCQGRQRRPRRHRRLGRSLRSHGSRPCQALRQRRRVLHCVHRHRP